MGMGELTTRQLVVIGLHQAGNAAPVIALRLGMNASDVRGIIKSPEAIAYLLEQEEATDQLADTLYRDGVEALKDGLHDADMSKRLKAAELTFRVIDKLKDDKGGDKGVHIDKLLAIIGAPISAAELRSVKRFFPAQEGDEEVYEVPGDKE